MIKPFRQLHIKLLALLAAVILWFVVITVENTVYKYPEKIDINILNLGSSMSLESSLPQVEIYLRTDKEDLTMLKRNDLEAYIDLENVKSGEYTLPVTAVSRSPLASVLKTEPGEVKIKISPVIEKEVGIEIVVQGRPEDGYKVGKTEADADTVKISGAQSVIDRIETVEGKIILDGTQKESLNQTVLFTLPAGLDSYSRLVTFNPPETLVEVEIVSEMSEKELKIVPRFFSENERNSYASRITVSPEYVKIKGDGDVLEGMDSLETLPVETSALIRNGLVETGVSLPEGTELSDPGQRITIRLNQAGLNDGPTI